MFNPFFPLFLLLFFPLHFSKTNQPSLHLPLISVYVFIVALLVFGVNSEESGGWRDMYCMID
jgi:hypothetical protein